MSNLNRKKILEEIQTKSIGFEDNGQTKSELLLIARDLQAISPEDFNASSPKKFRVIKCYLWSLLKNPIWRENFDEYVILYSKLWCRAHYTLNFLCHRMADVPLNRPQEIDEENLFWVPREAESAPRLSTYIYDKILGDESKSNMLLRQVFFPEFFPTKETALDVNIKQCMKENGTVFSHLTPHNWDTLMGRTGWAIVTEHASSLMRTNLELYIRQSVIRCSKVFVKLLQKDKEKELFDLLNRPWPEKLPQGIKQEAIEQIKTLRSVLGMDNESYLPNYACSISEALVDLHFFYSKIGILKRSVMPVAPLGRKFAYLDSRVGRHLFSIDSKSLTSPTQTVLGYLGLSLEGLKEAYDGKRKQLRKKQGNKGKKIRKKWKNKGKFMKPSNGIVRSILSDGVGLALRVSVPLDPIHLQKEKEETKKRKREKKNKQEIEILRMRNEDNGITPTFVGVDGGRAKLFCASTAKKGKSELSVFSYTRKHYYWDIGHAKRLKEEQQKVANDAHLKAAREALSNVGKECNLLRLVQVQKEHSAVLIREAIESKFYSFRKMTSFRLRKATLAKACNSLIDFGQEQGRHLVLGIGDAGFASVAKGEKAAPVKSINRSLNEVIKTRNMHQRNNQRSSISSLTINEFRTTLICSSCCSVTTQPWVQKPNGNIYKSSRMRLCMNCNSVNGKLRDRDVQASRNILRLTGYEYHGFPRPPELSRQKKSSKSQV